MLNQTDLEHIQYEMDRTLKNIKYVCTLVDNYKLNNEQFYLDWLDEINKYSTRD